MLTDQCTAKGKGNKDTKFTFFADGKDEIVLDKCGPRDDALISCDLVEGGKGWVHCK